MDYIIEKKCTHAWIVFSIATDDYLIYLWESVDLEDRIGELNLSGEGGLLIYAYIRLQDRARRSIFKECDRTKL
jgi:hypothetical protein